MNELPPLNKPYTCEAVMERLRKGNDIYCRRLKSKTMKFSVEDYVLPTDPPKQEPYAAILSCADSRVIPEHAFWAGEGELFVCRMQAIFLPLQRLPVSNMLWLTCTCLSSW